MKQSFDDYLIFIFAVVLLIILFCAVNVRAEEIFGTDHIITIGGAGTSSVGEWKTSGAIDPLFDQSLFSRDDPAEYTFLSKRPGNYTISIWSTSFPSRCSAVPVSVYDGGELVKSLTIDQLKYSGRWNKLVYHEFKSTPKIVVKSVGADCSTSVDSVLLSDSPQVPQILSMEVIK